MKRSKSSFGAKALVLTSLALGAGATIATAAQPQRIHPMPQSVWLQVTPRGLGLFDENFLGVLDGSGVPLRQVQLDKVEYQAKEPLKLDALDREGKQKPLQKLREEIKRWLMGFELNDPLFRVEVEKLSVTTAFEKMSLRILSNIPGSETPNGVRARLEVVIPSIEIRAASILGQDLSNDWLGKFGLTDFSSRIAETTQPIRITTDFDIVLKPQGRFELLPLNFDSNIASVSAQLNFASQLILPVVELRINGRTHQLDPSRVAQLVHDQKQALTLNLQAYAQAMVKERFPEWFAAGAKNIALTTVESGLRLPAMGAPDSLPEQKRQYSLGFYAERAGILSDGHLRISASSFIEDPRQGQGGASVPTRLSRGAPKWTAAEATPHDFALAIHPDVINRALDLSQDRGYFSEIKLADGSTIELYETPRFEIDSKVPAGMMRIKLALKKASGGGFKRLFVSKDVLLKFDGFVTVSRDTNGTFSMALKSVDLNSLKVDGDSATLGLFLGIVRNAVLKELTAFNNGLPKNPVMLVSKGEFCKELVGIKWTMIRATTEPESGFIVAYFGFDR